MSKSKLKAIRCTLQTMETVTAPRDYCIVTEGITMEMPAEFQLNIEKSVGVMTILDDQSLQLEITLQEFDKSESDFNFDIFRNNFDWTVISNLKVRLSHCITNNIIPTYLKSIIFDFDNGKSLDYSKKVTVFALMDLVAA